MHAIFSDKNRLFYEANDDVPAQIPVNRRHWDSQCSFVCFTLSIFSDFRRSAQYSGQLHIYESDLTIESYT